MINQEDRPTLSYAYGGDPPPLPSSLWSWFSSAGQSNPTNTALIVTHQSSHLLPNLISYSTSPPQEEHLTWTYAQLLPAVEILASYFSHHYNFVSGDNIIVLADSSNVAEWVLLFWTSIRLGGVFVPLDPVILKQDEEMHTLLYTLPPGIVLVQNPEQARKFDSYASATPPRFKLLCSNDAESSSSWLPLSSIKKDSQTSPAAVPQNQDPSSTVLVMCTSGSTNLPKACPISLRGLVSQTRQYHSFSSLNFSPATRHLITTAIFRPLCYLSCMNTWTAGGATIFDGEQPFEPVRALAALRELRISVAWFVPSMIRMLYTEWAKERKRKRLGELETVLMSGDAATREVVDMGRQMFEEEGKRRFVPHWGMSEGAPLFGFSSSSSSSSDDDMQLGQQPVYDPESGMIAGIGKALEGTRAKIVDTAGRIVERNQRGDLHVSSTATIDHYLSNRSVEDFYTDSDGLQWFKTGDTAIMDSNGVIFIVGRTKDIIKFKNLVLVPTVLEACLTKGFSGTEVCVVGVEDEIFGEVAVGVVKDLPAGEGVEVKRKMMEYVWENQGRDRGLEGGVYTLQELGLEEWPFNSLKKVMRKEVAEAVRRFGG